jgi:hypothetical protein
MLFSDDGFQRRKEPIPIDHPMWGATLTTQARFEHAAVEYSPENLIMIRHPFDGPSLQELPSHVHPYCVIVKASPVLASCIHPVPPELKGMAQIVMGLGFSWSNPFLSKSLCAIGSQRAPSSPDAGSHHSPRRVPYPPPASLPRAGHRANSGGWIGIGGGAAANTSSNRDDTPQKLGLHLSYDKAINPVHNFVGFYFTLFSDFHSFFIAGLQQESPSFDYTFSPPGSDSEDGMDELDALRLVRKVQPWRNLVTRQRSVPMPTAAREKGMMVL